MIIDCYKPTPVQSQYCMFSMIISLNFSHMIIDCCKMTTVQSSELP
jgi:hypothetical protein